MRVSDLLNEHLNWRGGPPLQENEISAFCEQCGVYVGLDTCKHEDTFYGMVYRCGSCPEALVRVVDSEEMQKKVASGAEVPDGAVTFKGGRRMGNSVLQNPSTLKLRGIELPGVPDCFIRR